MDFYLSSQWGAVCIQPHLAPDLLHPAIFPHYLFDLHCSSTKPNALPDLLLLDELDDVNNLI